MKKILSGRGIIAAWSRHLILLGVLWLFGQRFVHSAKGQDNRTPAPSFSPSARQLLELHEAMVRRKANLDDTARYLSSAPDTPGTAALLNAVASGYCSVDEYVKAEPLLQRALKISETTLGPEHPDTAETLNNLGELYAETHRYAMAEPLYQRALSIREKVLGPEHVATGKTLDSLAKLYKLMGEDAKAEPLGRRAEAIRKKASKKTQP